MGAPVYSHNRKTRKTGFGSVGQRPTAVSLTIINPNPVSLPLAGHPARLRSDRTSRNVGTYSDGEFTGSDVRRTTSQRGTMQYLGNLYIVSQSFRSNSNCPDKNSVLALDATMDPQPADMSPSRGGSSRRNSRRPRAKIPLACQPCRNRKSRCDGARPMCTRCQQRGLAREVCVYRDDATNDAQAS